MFYIYFLHIKLTYDTDATEWEQDKIVVGDL